MTSNRKQNGPSATNGASARPSASTPEPLAFEEALGQLDEAVAALESGQLPLEDALRIFEEGVRLTQRCQQALDNAELRIQRLRPRDDRDDEEMSPFALDDFEGEAQE